MKKLKVLDLFAGIGGFTLGLDSTDFFETVKFVDKDKYCQKVLQKNFPNIPIEEDIKNVKGKEGDADVIVGGFPCQPMSVAGKRKGTDDDRYLWPEMFRLIREIKPQFVIGENVQGIINIQNGMVLRQVQDDLESEGFEVQCFLIPASGIGAWHQRYRVWIVGYSEHNGLLASKIKKRNTETATGTQEGTNTTSEPKRTSGSRNDEDVSNTDTRLSIGENKEIQTRRETIDSSSSRGSEDVPNPYEQRTQVSTERKHAGIEMSGSSSQKTWWQTQSELCGVPNGLSSELDKNRANRIKTLGNAIVPQIAKELGLAMKKVLKGQETE